MDGKKPLTAHSAPPRRSDLLDDPSREGINLRPGSMSAQQSSECFAGGVGIAHQKPRRREPQPRIALIGRRQHRGEQFDGAGIVQAKRG
jgi:hypothetical protein